MANPWDNDPIVGRAPTGGPVYGAPPKAPTPLDMKREARADEDQTFQREKFQWEREKHARDLEAGVGVDGKARESEANAAAFLIRALGSNDSYEAQGIGPRSLVGQKLNDYAPNVLNSLPEAIGNSPERQVADTTQDEFIAASLRQDSGAAIPEEEMERQRRIYFPMPGDTPEAIAAKRQARLRAIEGLKQSSGVLAESAIKRWQGMGGAGTAPDAGLQITATDDSDQGVSGTVTDDRPAGPGDTPPPAGGGPNPDAAAIANDRRFYGDPNSLSGLSALAKQGVTFGLSDEAAGVGGFLSDLVRGGNPVEGYRRDRDADRIYNEQARDAWGVPGTLAELLGGGGAVRIGLNAAPTVGRTMVEGAGFGAGGGFGYGEGAEGSIANAGAGAAMGGALGGLLGGGGRLLSNRGSKPINIDTDVVEAGARQDIPIRQPDARPEMRGQYAAAESTQGGGPLIRQARADDAGAIASRAEEIGGGRAYNHADSTALGQTAQKIAERGNENVKQAASNLYKRVERTAPGFSVPGTQTTNFIDQKIAALEAQSPTGYSAEISALQNMKDDLQKTGLSVETLQAQRMTVGGRIGDNIADRTRADATLSEVLDVAGQELHTSLGQANPAAAAVLKRADAKWGQYKDLQRQVTSQFLGKRGDATAETAARALEGMVNGKGNYSALRRYMTLATPEERADFATTFALEWGRTARGRGEFSPAEMAKNLGNLSDRTLHALFGQKGTTALRDLQTITNAKTDAMSRQAPSGQAISSATGKLKTMLMGALGFVGAGPGGAAAGAYGRELFAKWGEQRAARMLLNPDFTKLLKNAPNTNNPKAINAWLGRIGGISSIAANDNQAFAGAVRASLNASPGRVSAASEQEQD